MGILTRELTSLAMYGPDTVYSPVGERRIIRRTRSRLARELREEQRGTKQGRRSTGREAQARDRERDLPWLSAHANRLWSNSQGRRGPTPTSFAIGPNATVRCGGPGTRTPQASIVEELAAMGPPGLEPGTGGL